MNRKTLTRITMLAAMMVLLGLMSLPVALAIPADTTAPAVSSVTPADGSKIYTNGSSSIYYQSGNATPLTIRATYADEPGGSGVDVTSIMVHLDGSNMLYNCPTQTETEVACNATAADLFPGTHPVDIYVGDLEGNMTMHRTWVTVVQDSTAPAHANLSIANGSTIYTSQLNSTSINDMSALRFDYDIVDGPDSSGVVPMTHVNESVPPGVLGAMIMNSSCVKTPDANNTTHYSCQVNRAKLLHLGDNTLAILLKDRVGNMSVDYTDLASHKHYTVVDDMDPVVSNLAAGASSITADFSDPQPTGALSTLLAAGVDSGTAAVTIDGNAVGGCAATGAGISCPTPAGLSVGDHTVVVSVDDLAGNTGSASTTLTVDPPPCVPGKPSLSLSMNRIFWADMAAYESRELSIEMLVTNIGAGQADAVAITGASSTSGVIMTSPVPIAVGSIASSASAPVTVKHLVPQGVTSFRSNVTATAMDNCGSSYDYPG